MGGHHPERTRLAPYENEWLRCGGYFAVEDYAQGRYPSTSIVARRVAPRLARNKSMRDAFAGALGSGLMVMVTQPMDTCKVNLQQHTSYAKSPSVVARSLTSTGGVRVLWAGTLPALYLYVTEHAVTAPAIQPK